MRNMKELALMLAVGLLLPVVAHAECDAPKTPELPPNGARLSYEELNAAADMVSDFAKANADYRACLNKIIHKPESRSAMQAALDADKKSGPTEAKVWDAYDKLQQDWVAVHEAKKSKTQ